MSLKNEYKELLVKTTLNKSDLVFTLPKVDKGTQLFNVVLAPLAIAASGELAYDKEGACQGFIIPAKVISEFLNNDEVIGEKYHPDITADNFTEIDIQNAGVKYTDLRLVEIEGLYYLLATATFLVSADSQQLRLNMRSNVKTTSELTVVMSLVTWNLNLNPS